MNRRGPGRYLRYVGYVDNSSRVFCRTPAAPISEFRDATQVALQHPKLCSESPLRGAELIVQLQLSGDSGQYFSEMLISADPIVGRPISTSLGSASIASHSA
jgi:hypothetical protein